MTAGTAKEAAVPEVVPCLHEQPKQAPNLSKGAEGSVSILLATLQPWISSTEPQHVWGQSRSPQQTQSFSPPKNECPISTELDVPHTNCTYHQKPPISDRTISDACQNYGPLLGPLTTRCRIILRTQNGTIILTTTHILVFGCRSLEMATSQRPLRDSCQRGAACPKQKMQDAYLLAQPGEFVEKIRGESKASAICGATIKGICHIFSEID